MQKVKLGIVAVLFIISFIYAGEEADKARTFGDGVSIQDTTRVSDILSAPEKYVGRSVAVKGTIVNVCKKRGCWMALSGDKEFESIRIKVDDGVIVFPFESRGKTAIAQGQVETFELTMEQTIKYLQHEAECNGDAFDPKSVTKPKLMVQIKGTGALIFE